MGLTHIEVTIRNPADSSRTWKGAFLVDTGAIDSLVPREHLESIGLRPEGRRPDAPALFGAFPDASEGGVL